jgi:hypothetical protein
MRTVLAASPLVIAKFKEDTVAYDAFRRIGLFLSYACTVMHMNSSVAANYPMMTNSNKLRTSSTARFFVDDDVVRILVHGVRPSEQSTGRDPDDPVGPVAGHASTGSSPAHQDDLSREAGH